MGYTYYIYNIVIYNVVYSAATKIVGLIKIPNFENSALKTVLTEMGFSFLDPRSPRFTMDALLAYDVHCWINEA